MMAENDDPWDNLIVFEGFGYIKNYPWPKMKEVRFVGGPSDGEVHPFDADWEGKLRKIHLVPEPGADTSKPHRLIEADGGTYIIEGEVARFVDPGEEETE